MSKIRTIDWYCDNDGKWHEFKVGIDIENCSKILITEILTGKEIKELLK